MPMSRLVAECGCIDDQLAAELRQWTRKEIGPIATPDLLQWAPAIAKNALGQDHAAHFAENRRQ